MKIRLLFKYIILAILTLNLVSCMHQPDISSSPKIAFSEIQSIINIKCSSCHGTAEPYFLLDSTRILQLVEPYKPANSILFNIVTNTYSENFMPPLPDSPLSSEQRTKLYLWILQGASPSASGNPSGGNDSVSFVSEVLPIYISNCTTSGCHDAITHREGYNLTSYSGIRSGVVPNNPNLSRVYTVMSASGEDRMPPPPLPSISAEQKAIIAKWINQGAKNTNFSSNCDTTKYTFTDINHIVQSSCVGCHNSSSAGGGIQLSTYAQIKAIADNGALVRVITQNTMPKGSPLIDCKKTQIIKWVNDGSQNN